jgi:hypothetical protein
MNNTGITHVCKTMGFVNVKFLISNMPWLLLQAIIKVEAPITDRGPISDFIFKSHTFPRHVSMKAIDNCLKLKLSGIGSSTL